MDCYNIDFDILFETSWEVCNKVGGIYTVLSTKAKTLQNCYKDKTIFIGPDVWTEENPSPFFTESKTVLKKWREQAILPPAATGLSLLPIPEPTRLSRISNAAFSLKKKKHQPLSTHV